MGFASRLPNSNEPTFAAWTYGPQSPHDDFSALLNGLARRCDGCRRVTLHRHLVEKQCPECAARKEMT